MGNEQINERILEYNRLNQAIKEIDLKIWNFIISENGKMYINEDEMQIYRDLWKRRTELDNRCKELMKEVMSAVTRKNFD